MIKIEFVRFMERGLWKTTQRREEKEKERFEELQCFVVRYCLNDTNSNQ